MLKNSFLLGGVQSCRGVRRGRAVVFSTSSAPAAANYFLTVAILSIPTFELV